jgi:RNA polymerase sigma-70 factor (ECF subfamily)
MNQPAEHQPDHLGSLMGRAQGGDKAAYDTLLRECANIARRVLRRRFPVLGSADAEDLVQDILLSLHGVRATFDARRPFVPWLLAIIRNRAADAARSYARRTGREITVAEYPETFDTSEANTVGEGYGDTEELRQAVQRLPEGQRVAIELLKLKEMSLKEASEKSGMTVGALKVATHRATHALRAALAKDSRGH